MKLKEKYGRTALVAGASEGIGAAFSEFLAKEGIDLILIARKKLELQQFADKLAHKYAIHTMCLSVDLSESDAIEKISAEIKGQEINLVVYNAALSHIGPFINNSDEDNLKIARANMMTPLKMVHLVGQRMIAHGKGAIIFMSSLAGFQGSAYLALYAATKAFIRILSEGLWYEWKNRGVDVIACCAGATSSPNYLRTQPESTGFFAPRILSPDEVVMECFMNLGRKPSFIPGRGNRIASFFMQKILTRKIAIDIMGRTTRKIYKL